MAELEEDAWDWGGDLLDGFKLLLFETPAKLEGLVGGRWV